MVEGRTGYLEEAGCPRCGFPGVFLRKTPQTATNFLHKSKDAALRCTMVKVDNVTRTSKEVAQDA